MVNIHPSAFVHLTAVLGNNVTIGEGSYIGPLCIIGFPAEYRGRETQDTGVWIGKNVRITGLVTIDTGTGSNPTYIGHNCYLMKHCHVGHDAHLCDGVTLSCGAKIGGHATICFDTNIGLNAVIHQKVIVPEGCMIGASAFIGKTLEMKPYSKYAGVPARYIGENVKP